MSDLAHKLTDEELDALEKKIKREYERAGKEVQAKADDYFSKFTIKDAEKQQLVKDGKLTQKEYALWRQNQMLTGKRWNDLRDQLASDLSVINQSSAVLMGERMNRVFALNRNFSAYDLEHGLGLNLQFTLYDERTVARLLRDNPRLLPKPKVDIPLDKLWNKGKITSEITQGILQGEELPKIAARLQAVTDMNRNSAVRNARTAMTGAQNAGRMDSYDYAQKIGIRLQKEWLATLDNRTRDEHRALDGQKVDIDEPFKVDGAEIMFPGDPSAEGYLVYGCRCTMISAIDGVEDLEPVYRRDNISGELVEDQSYSEWYNAKNAEAEKIIDYDLIDPRDIELVNRITSEDKRDALAWQFHENGYDGRPILAVDTGGGAYQALTGSHRIDAAREANIEIPTKVIPYSDDIAPLLEAKTDEDRLVAAKELFEGGSVDSDVVALLQKEDVMNFVESISNQASDAEKWREYKESLSAVEKIEEAARQEEAKALEAANLSERLASTEMQDYLNFKSSMEEKYPGGIWGGMSGDEMEEWNRLERKAYKGF